MASSDVANKMAAILGMSSNFWKLHRPYECVCKGRLHGVVHEKTLVFFFR